MDIPKQLSNPDFRFIKIKKKSKKPAQQHWSLKDSHKWNDPELQKWINNDGNYAIINISGNLLVIDADDLKISKIITDSKLPKTLVVQTGTVGKRHIYYFCEDSKICKQLLEGKLGDIRGCGDSKFYTVCPGSVHPNGTTYKVVIDSEIATIKEQDIIDVLEPYFKKKNAGKKTKHTLEGVDEGERDNTLFKYACKLHRDEYTIEQAYEMVTIRGKNSNPPFPESECRQKVDSAYSYPEQEEKKETIASTKEAMIEELQDPQLLFNIIREVHKKHSGEYDTIMAMICQASTRFVKNVEPESQNITLTGEPGIGKDRLAKAVYDVIGGSNYSHLAKVTPEALAYFHNQEKGWTWDGKILVIEDPTTGLINSQTFKTLLSGKGKTGISVLKGKAQEIKITGKPVMIVTTAEGEEKNEMIRRLPCIHLDPSEELTKDVKKQQARRYGGEDAQPERNSDLINALHTMIKPYKVKIPYYDLLDKYFPNTVLMRTYFQRFLDYIAGSTILYQHQRKKDDKGWLIATGEDYELARVTFLKTVTNDAMISLTDIQQKIFNYIVDKESVFPKDIEVGLPASHWSVSNTIKLLKTYDLITAETKWSEKANRFCSLYTTKKGTALRLPLWNVVGWSFELTNLLPKSNISRRDFEIKMWSFGSVVICNIVPGLRKKYLYTNNTLYRDTVKFFDKYYIITNDQPTDDSTGELVSRTGVNKRPNDQKLKNMTKRGIE